MDRLQFRHAHGCGSRRWRPVTVQSRFVSRRLPRHAVHRVQRCARYLSLLCQQVELLVGNCRGADTVRPTTERNAQSRKLALTRQPLSSLHQKLKIKQLLHAPLSLSLSPTTFVFIIQKHNAKVAKSQLSNCFFFSTPTTIYNNTSVLSILFFLFDDTCIYFFKGKQNKIML